MDVQIETDLEVADRLWLCIGRGRLPYRRTDVTQWHSYSHVAQYLYGPATARVWLDATAGRPLDVDVCVAAETELLQWT